MTAAVGRVRHVHRLLDANGPFASLYFDDSHDAPDAASRLEVTCADIVRDLESLGAEAMLTSVVSAAILSARPRVRHGGRGLIATVDGVLVDEDLVVPPPRRQVRVSELPYVVPLVEHASAVRTYVVAAIDHAGADIGVHHGDSVHCETVEGPGFPVHENNAGIHGWGDNGHRVQEAIRKNVRAVADALTEIVDRHDPEVVFLIGQDRVRAQLASMLPERVCARVVRPRVGARHTGVDQVVRQAIDLELGRRLVAATDEVAERFLREARRGSGGAVEGLAAVCNALRENAVSALLLGDLADATVHGADAATLLATDVDELAALANPSPAPCVPTRRFRLPLWPVERTSYRSARTSECSTAWRHCSGTNPWPGDRSAGLRAHDEDRAFGMAQDRVTVRSDELGDPGGLVGTDDHHRHGLVLLDQKLDQIRPGGDRVDVNVGKPLPP